DHGVEEFQKLVRSAYGEAVHRVPYNVSMNVLSEMKTNREAARAGILCVIVGNRGKSREVGESCRHRSGNTLNMRRPCERYGLGRRFELACQQYPLRVRRPEPGMRSAIDLVECFDNVATQGQHLLVCRQRHSWYLLSLKNFQNNASGAACSNEIVKFSTRAGR